MRKLITRLTVALVTFTIGMLVSSDSRSPVPRESQQVAKEVDQIKVEQPKELPPLKQEVKANESSDLSIVVHVSGDPQSFTLRPIKLAKHRRTIIDLDLGEDIDSSEVTLNFRDTSVQYRMFQRYRTSMSISAEGPHLDLVDWRHFDSPWTHLPSLSVNRFRTLASDQMEDSKFPLTTKSEIIKEVSRRVGNDWPRLLELVRDCRGLNDGACQVMISSTYLRIQKQVGNRWIEAGLVEFRIPMGC